MLCPTCALAVPERTARCPFCRQWVTPPGAFSQPFVRRLLAFAGLLFGIVMAGRLLLPG
jgi:anti-sigma factor RsiW